MLRIDRFGQVDDSLAGIPHRERGIPYYDTTAEMVYRGEWQSAAVMRGWLWWFGSVPEGTAVPQSRYWVHLHNHLASGIPPLACGQKFDPALMTSTLSSSGATNADLSPRASRWAAWQSLMRRAREIACREATLSILENSYE